MARQGVITVIGGLNTDICGTPAAALRRHDSNPGRVSIRGGGVGRNIACNLARLGFRVRLITALGDDALGAAARADCRERGVDLSLCPAFPGLPSSVYLYLTDERGEMDAAVSDMAITDRLSPALLSARMGEINASDAVVLDANLSEETIAFLAERVSVPLYADPVSAAKAPRLTRALPCLRAIKPNLLEARALTGRQSAEDCAAALLEQGVERVFLSLGPAGLLAADRDEQLLLPRREITLVNATGAGDAAAAALVWADAEGLSLADSARAAQRAGALTVGCEENVSSLLSPAALRRD